MATELKCEGIYTSAEHEEQTPQIMFFEVFGDERRVRTVVCEHHVGAELTGMALDGHYMCEAIALTNFDGSLTDAGYNAGVEV